MATSLPQPVQRLIDTLSRLPGIGPKMAARLAIHLLSRPARERTELTDALTALSLEVHTCPRCGYLSTGELCDICTDTSRTRSICVVQGPLDVVALERSGSFRGLYHVLGGVLSPLDGIGPEELRIASLVTRVQELLADTNSGAVEVLLATNPSLEGEATALYIQRALANLENDQLSITRIARGLPVGSDIEYADPATLTRALEGRSNL
jgi:recombination protein RecR